jgi:hypothetical protein
LAPTLAGNASGHARRSERSVSSEEGAAVPAACNNARRPANTPSCAVHCGENSQWPGRPAPDRLVVGPPPEMRRLLAGGPAKLRLVRTATPVRVEPRGPLPAKEGSSRVAKVALLRRPLLLRYREERRLIVGPASAATRLRSASGNATEHETARLGSPSRMSEVLLCAGSSSLACLRSNRRVVRVRTRRVGLQRRPCHGAGRPRSTGRGLVRRPPRQLQRQPTGTAVAAFSDAATRKVVIYLHVTSTSLVTFLKSANNKRHVDVIPTYGQFSLRHSIHGRVKSLPSPNHHQRGDEQPQQCLDTQHSAPTLRINLDDGISRENKDRKRAASAGRSASGRRRGAAVPVPPTRT